jgi:polyhydroxybutyrate depolymerase
MKFRCLYRRCLPLPIPNREVKPARADGTAVKRGRVGRCPILNQAPFSNIGGFFYAVNFGDIFLCFLYCIKSIAMYRLKLFLILLFSIFCFVAQVTDIDKSIVVDGLNRQYLIHLPPGYANTQMLPVIFALHGGGGEYKSTPKLYNLNTLADQYNFIVVYPNALNKSWSMKGVDSRVKGNTQDIDDVHFISVLMDTLIRYNKADRRRFFCTGLSRGGIFSFFLASRLSSRIRAIAPVCAAIPVSIGDTYTFQHPMPVLMINGTADPLILYNGGEGRFTAANAVADQNNMLPAEELVQKVAKLNHCNGVAKVDLIPDTDPSDGCTATKYTYAGPNADVIFIKITNGGHTWPGGTQYLPKFIIGKLCRDFKAEDEIFRFFMSVK